MNSQGPKQSIYPMHNIFHKWFMRLARIDDISCRNDLVATVPSPALHGQFNLEQSRPLSRSNHRNWSVGHSWTNHMCCQILKYCHLGPISSLRATTFTHVYTSFILSDADCMRCFCIRSRLLQHDWSNMLMVIYGDEELVACFHVCVCK